MGKIYAVCNYCYGSGKDRATGAYSEDHICSPCGGKGTRRISKEEAEMIILQDKIDKLERANITE